jgi:urea carboxylase
VGIGAYLCVYGMEGPGATSLLAVRCRCGIAITRSPTSPVNPGCCVFDQLRFYPVSAEELQQIRRDFPLGRYPLRIEHSTLRLAEYQQFLQQEAVSIDAFASISSAPSMRNASAG